MKCDDKTYETCYIWVSFIPKRMRIIKDGTMNRKSEKIGNEKKTYFHPPGQQLSLELSSAR